jgi:uncharacterized protein (TIGR03000 family)
VPVLVGLGMLSMNPLVDAKGGGGGGGHGGGGGGHGGGGGGRGGSMHAGSMHGGNMHGGNFNHGNFNHGNFNRGGVFFYGGLYPGYGYGSPYWYNYGPGNYDYGYAEPYPVYVSPNYSNQSYLNPTETAPSVPSAGLNNTAEIDVMLPRGDAKVWVDGTPMTAGSGTQRAFVSPALEQGYSYSYRVTATWTENGQEVRVERRVPVAPGRVSIMDFTKINQNQTMPRAPE